MDRFLPRPAFWAESAAQTKTRFTLVGETMILLLLYFISLLAQGFLMAIPTTAWVLSADGLALTGALASGASLESMVETLTERMPDWMELVSLYTAAVIGAAALLYCLKLQKRSPASMGLRKPGALKESLLGFGAGLVLFLAIVGVGVAAKAFRPVSLRLEGSRIVPCVFALLGCLVQGAALELLIRGSYTPALGGRYPVIFTLIFSALIPALLMSPGSFFSMTTLNTVLLGLLLGVWALKRGNIWGSCALRAAWTFAGSFLFNFAPAGEHQGVRLLEMDLDLYRSLLSGGEFGPVASICATVVLLGGLALVLALRPRDPAPTAAETGAANFL